MEIIAVFHLVVAAVGYYRLTRLFALDEISCVFGSLTWTFCSFVIFTGDSWIQTVGYAAYLPWILFYSLQQIYRFELKWFIALIFLKVCNMLLGYPQYFIYTMTFEFLTVICVWLSSKYIKLSMHIDNRDKYSPPSFIRLISAFICSYLVVIIVALPLVIQTLHQTSVSASRSQLLSWDEYVAFSYKLTYWLSGLVAPFKNAYPNTQFELHYLSNIGYLPLIFIAIAIVFITITVAVNKDIINNISKINIRTLTSQAHISNCVITIIFTLLAIVSLLWASDIGITKMFYHVPIYNRLRFPFKVGFFTSFFMVMVSTFGFDMIYSKLKSSDLLVNTRNILITSILILHVINILVVNTAEPQRMFSRHFDIVPFDEPLKDIFADGRIVSASIDDVWDGEKIVPGFSAPLLGFDYATLWGVYQFGGYDPMVSYKNQSAAFNIKFNPVFNLPSDEPFSMHPDTLEYFRKWGVKWYVVDKRVPLPVNSEFQLYAGDSIRYILMDRSAKSLVYWKNYPNDTNTIRYVFKTNSIEVYSDKELNDTIVINVLYNPYFIAHLDGKTIPISESRDGQVLLDAPKGKHVVVLTYVDKPFLYSLIISVVTVIILVQCLLIKRIRRRFINCLS
jgi:hypothetical protein